MCMEYVYVVCVCCVCMRCIGKCMCMCLKECVGFEPIPFCISSQVAKPLLQEHFSCLQKYDRLSKREREGEREPGWILATCLQIHYHFYLQPAVVCLRRLFGSHNSHVWLCIWSIFLRVCVCFVLFFRAGSSTCTCTCIICRISAIPYQDNE